MTNDNNTIKECKFFMDPDKEIEFFNEMNQKGWKLVFIKWGMFYTFEKCEPGEYITLLHADEKENLSKVTTFAVSCGYEIIPHTMDGLGNTVYLTGRKEDVSEDFVSDSNDKITFYKIFKKNFSNLLILYAIVDLLLILVDVGFTLDCIRYNGSFPSDMTLFFSIYYLFTAINIGFTVKLMQVIGKYNKKIKTLKQEALIFE